MLEGILNWISVLNRDMKVGDLVWFREDHEVHYTTGRYILERGPWIVASEPVGGTCVIFHPSNKENHFIFSSNGGFQKLIGLEEWRDIKVSRLLE